MKFQSCQIEWRYAREESLLSLGAVEPTFVKVEEVVGPCGTPLFSNREERFGVCRSCFSGWEVPTNRLTDRGVDAVLSAQEIVAREENL